MDTETTRPPATSTPTSTPDPDPTLGSPPGYQQTPSRRRSPDQATRSLPPDWPTVADDAPADESLSPSGSLTTPSQVSTGDPEACAELVTTAARIPTLFLNRRRGAGTDLWLLDDQDTEAICEPLGRILARHAPLGDDETNDLFDGLLAGMGVGGYVLKNVEAERKLSAQRGGATIEVNQQPPPAA